MTGCAFVIWRASSRGTLVMMKLPAGAFEQTIKTVTEGAAGNLVASGIGALIARMFSGG
jgi:hypothetical protein